MDTDKANNYLEQPALDVVLVPFVRAAAAALRRVCDVPVVVAWAFASAVPKRKAVDVDAGADLACHLDSHQPAGGRVPALEDQPCGLLETGAEGGHQGNSMPDDPAGAEQQLVVRVRLLHLLAQCLKMPVVSRADERDGRADEWVGDGHVNTMASPSALWWHTQPDMK